MDVPGLSKELDIGAAVVGRDGKELGKVTYVVVQPPEMELVEIVVRTGAVLGRDVVVPVSRIRDVKDGKIFLSLDQEDLKNYPDYIEVNYQVPPPGWIPPADFYFPSAAVLMPATEPIPLIEKVRVNTPPGTRSIREGMDVETGDGQKIGSVDKVEVDLATNEITGFAVKRGFLFAHDVWITIKDVREIRDDKVILKFTKDQIQRLEREQRSD